MNLLVIGVHQLHEKSNLVGCCYSEIGRLGAAENPVNVISGPEMGGRPTSRSISPSGLPHRSQADPRPPQLDLRRAVPEGEVGSDELAALASIHPQPGELDHLGPLPCFACDVLVEI